MKWHIPYSSAANALENSGKKFVEFMRRADMSLELYRPGAVDEQKPHAQDELYIVVSGHAHFTKSGESVACSTGDVLFVEAAAEHCFSNASTDFAVWVIFYGPASSKK